MKSLERASSCLPALLCHAVHAGNYFNSTAAALRYNENWITTAGLARTNGLDTALDAMPGGVTLFVPNVRAWKPVEPRVRAAAAAVVADLLRYHALPGARSIPKDIRPGRAATLLTGHAVMLSVNTRCAQRYIQHMLYRATLLSNPIPKPENDPGAAGHSKLDAVCDVLCKCAVRML